MSETWPRLMWPRWAGSMPCPVRRPPSTWGTGRGTTVRELADAFNRVADSPIQVRETGRRPGDVAGAYTRVGRAERLLGWRARYDIAGGIRHSLQWATVRDEIRPLQVRAGDAPDSRRCGCSACTPRR